MYFHSAEQVVTKSDLETAAMKTINTHEEELTIALSFDLDLIAGILISSNFFQDDILLKMSNDDDPIEKAAILVEAVTKEIEVAPEKFTKFLDILSENLYTTEVAETLNFTYLSEFTDPCKMIH